MQTALNTATVVKWENIRKPEDSKKFWIIHQEHILVLNNGRQSNLNTLLEWEEVLDGLHTPLLFLDKSACLMEKDNSVQVVKVLVVKAVNLQTQIPKDLFWFV